MPDATPRSGIATRDRDRDAAASARSAAAYEPAPACGYLFADCISRMRSQDWPVCFRHPAHAEGCDQASGPSHVDDRRNTDSDNGRECRPGPASLWSRGGCVERGRNAAVELPTERGKWSKENGEHCRRHSLRQKPHRETIDRLLERRRRCPAARRKNSGVKLGQSTKFLILLFGGEVALLIKQGIFLPVI